MENNLDLLFVKGEMKRGDENGKKNNYDDTHYILYMLFSYLALMRERDTCIFA